MRIVDFIHDITIEETYFRPEFALLIFLISVLGQNSISPTGRL